MIPTIREALLDQVNKDLRAIILRCLGRAYDIASKGMMIVFHWLSG